ncbi:hypothetical protein V8C42DRAFT_337479 [Trichoderma barbatum]
MPRDQEAVQFYNSGATMSIHSSTSATDTIAMASDSSKADPNNKLRYARTGASTADSLNRIDVGEDEVMGELKTCHIGSGHGNLWERNKFSTQQLPTRECIARLTEFNFQKIDWLHFA